MRVSPGQGCCDALTIEVNLGGFPICSCYPFVLPKFFFFFEVGGGFKQAENTALTWLLLEVEGRVTSKHLGEVVASCQHARQVYRRVRNS